MEQKIYSLEDIKKDPSIITPDWKKWVNRLAEDPSKSGWTLAADKQIGDYKDTNLTVYTKQIDNDPLNYIRWEMKLKGISVEKYLAMMSNTEVRKKWDDKLISDQPLLRLPNNGAIGYRQMKMPGLMSNRDSLSKYFMICNKKHPELVEKYGLPQKSNKYYAVLIEPIKLHECPKNKDFERCDMFMFLIAEETEEQDVIKISGIMHMDLGGWIPDWAMNMGSANFQFKMMEEFLKHYPELDKQGLLVLQYQ